MHYYKPEYPEKYIRIPDYSGVFQNFLKTLEESKNDKDFQENLI